MSSVKYKCDNCGALVESIGTTTDGKKICCVECCFNPLGCRCQYGEYGVAETEDWAALSGLYDELNDDDNDEIEFTACDNCDGHPACEDFGCAIALGIKINPPFLDSSSL